MNVAWKPDFADASPVFMPLRTAVCELHAAVWPGCADFNRVLATRATPILNACGQRLRFVEQAARATAFEDKYEPRIFLRGEVQLRAGDWHDVFNALVWLTYPRAKAALNESHFRALERQREHGKRNRGPAQDALTLFDESGVVVIFSDRELGELLARHAWKELFWRRRAETAQQMRFFLFGHGLYAKMLRPFEGVTGRGLMCDVTPDFMTLTPAQQIEYLDLRIAARIANAAHPLAARELAPVPLLGIPGWCDGNGSESYYDNTAYFRPPPALAAPLRD
jgi:hypothetical protein